MIVSEKLHQALKKSDNIPSLVKVLQAIDVNRPPAVNLIELKALDNSSLLPWLEKLEHFDTLLTACIDMTTPTKPTLLSDKDFNSYYCTKYEPILAQIKIKYTLTPIQTLLLDSKLSPESAQIFIKQLGKNALPLEDHIFYSCLNSPAIIDELQDPSNKNFSEGLTTNLQRQALYLLKTQSTSSDDIKSLFDPAIANELRFKALATLGDLALAKAYFQTHPVKDIELRIELYKTLLEHNRMLFDCYLALEPQLDELLLKTAQCQHMQVFTAIAESKKNTPVIQQWARKLAAVKQCPLAALLVLEKNGANFHEIDETSKANFYHLATLAENDDLVRHLLLSEGERPHSKKNPRLSAYQPNHLGESAIDIAKRLGNRRLLDLFNRFSYPINDTTHKPDHLFNPYSKKYLIFCGGGVKAVAYSQALRRYLDERFLSLDGTKGAAGTSAGAIAALLVSLNYTMDEMDKTFKQFDLKKLIDYDAGSFNPDDLPKIISFLQGISQNIVNSMDLIGYAWQWVRGTGEIGKVRALKDTITKNGGGICPGNKLTEWFKSIIEEKTSQTSIHKMTAEEITFKDLATVLDDNGEPVFKDLRIMAVNFDKGKLESFDAYRTPHVTVLSAMRATVSMPLIFAPTKIMNRIEVAGKVIYKESHDRYVDGGLINNFPFYAYSDKDPKHQQTYGFYLANEKDVDDLRHGRMIYTKFEDSSVQADAGQDLSMALLRILQCPQENIFADDIVRHNTLLIPIATSIGAFDVSNPSILTQLESAGLSSANEKLAFHAKQMQGNFSPYLYKLIANLGMIRFDSQSKDIFLSQPNPRFFGSPPSPTQQKRKLLPAEIVKIYARATTDEVRYLSQIVSPHLTSPDGLTALHIAYAFNLENTVKKLLSANANKRAIWNTASGKKVSAKDCKYHNEFQNELIALGVPDYFKKGESQVKASKKMRLEARLASLDAEKSQLDEHRNSLKHQLGQVETSLERERSQYQALYLSLLELLRQTDIKEPAAMKAILDESFRQNLALHDDAYQNLRQALEKALLEVKLSENQVGLEVELRQKVQLKLDDKVHQVAKMEVAQNLDAETIRSLKVTLAEQLQSIEEAQNRITLMSDEITLLKSTIDKQAHALIEKEQVIANTHINRLLWRNTHREYKSRREIQIAGLMTELKNEISWLKDKRQNFLLRIFLPLIPLIMDLKIRQKAEKIKALNVILSQLSSDNEHSTREIVETVEKKFPGVKGGLFSRCRVRLEKLAELEEKSCNLDFGKTSPVAVTA